MCVLGSKWHSNEAGMLEEKPWSQSPERPHEMALPWWIHEGSRCKQFWLGLWPDSGRQMKQFDLEDAGIYIISAKSLYILF